MTNQKDLIETSYEVISENRPLHQVGTVGEFAQKEINSAYNQITAQLATLLKIQKSGFNWINKNAEVKKSLSEAISAHKDLISTFEDIIT